MAEDNYDMDIMKKRRNGSPVFKKRIQIAQRSKTAKFPKMHGQLTQQQKKNGDIPASFKSSRKVFAEILGEFSKDKRSRYLGQSQRIFAVSQKQ